MTSEQTLRNRLARRKKDAVMEAMRENGVNVYLLDAVHGSPSPHLVVLKLCEDIIKAVEETK